MHKCSTYDWIEMKILWIVGNSVTAKRSMINYEYKENAL